jgi:hypothetical protein
MADVFLAKDLDAQVSRGDQDPPVAQPRGRAALPHGRDHPQQHATPRDRPCGGRGRDAGQPAVHGARVPGGRVRCPSASHGAAAVARRGDVRDPDRRRRPCPPHRRHRPPRPEARQHHADDSTGPVRREADRPRPRPGRQTFLDVQDALFTPDRPSGTRRSSGTDRHAAYLPPEAGAVPRRAVGSTCTRSA